MYKIYIKESLLTLASIHDEASLKSQYPKALFGRYNGKTKQLFTYIDLLEKSKTKKSVILTYDSFDRLKKDFKSLYITIKASGGLVITEDQEALFIFKRGKWDLPKGKIDKGESKEDAAIREVEEETGVTNLKLGDRLCKTRHTFKTRAGKRAIKKTYWYHMTTHKQALVPQVEEDIEKVEWIPPTDMLTDHYTCYNNLKLVIKAYLEAEQYLVAF